MSFFAEVPEEVFEERRHSWIDLVSEDFPFHEPDTRWNLRIEQRTEADAPFLKGGAPQIEILDWCRDQKKNAATKAIRAFPTSDGHAGGGSFHVMTGVDRTNYRRFEDLETLTQKWLPAWRNHFNPLSFKSMVLQYVNKINIDSAPTFVHRENGVEIGRILRVFNGLPMQYESLTHPYDCRIGLVFSKKDQLKGEVKISGEKDRSGIAVELIVRKTFEGLAIPIDLGISDFIVAHTKLLELFSSVFTEEARQKFTHP